MTEWEIGYKLCHYKYPNGFSDIFIYRIEDSVHYWLDTYKSVSKEMKEVISLDNGYYWEETLVQIK